MLNRFHKGFITAVTLLYGVNSLLGIAVYVQKSGERWIVNNPSETKQSQTILVLGASVDKDGKPSDALTDRVTLGAQIWNGGFAPTLFLSGDDGRFRSPEIPAMRQLAIDRIVPESAILTDGQGYRTYESCKRAHEKGIQSAIVVTQRFHLARALYLCHAFGIDVQGIAADAQPYVEFNWFMFRDLLASVKAWIDLNVKEPKAPVKN